MKKGYLTTIYAVYGKQLRHAIMSLLFVFGLATLNSVCAQTNVDSWSTTTVPNTLDSRVATGGETLNFGAAASTSVVDISVAGDTYVPVPSPLTVTLRRIDNIYASGDDFDPWFREDNSGFNEAVNNYSAPYYATANDVISANIIDIGLDNTFNNSISPMTSNIERIDVVFNTSKTLRSIDLNSGFPIFERNGIGDISVAVITGVDGSGNPTSYSNVVVNTAYGANLVSNYVYDLLTKSEAAVQYDFGYDGGDQTVNGTLFKWSDFGLLAGQTIYGYSVAGSDVPTTAAGFLDWSTFPTGTTQPVGGSADLIFNFQYFAADNDIDGDGVQDFADLDNDNDGILDSDEGFGDSDGDTIPDYLDNDSDNDGCPDAIEASGAFTLVDGNGRLTGGVDVNGVPTVVGAAGQSTNADVITAGPDLDGDGIADACDSTDDRPDYDNDGVIDLVDLDDDNDGILDADEQNCGTVNVIDDFNAPLWNYGTGNGGDASGSGTIKGVPFTMAYNVNGGSKLFSSTGQYTSNSTLGHGGNPGSLLLSGPDESITFTFASPLTVVIGFDHLNANDDGWLFGTPADEIVSSIASHQVIGSPASIDGVEFINNFAIPNITGVSYFKWENITTLTLTTKGPLTTTVGLNSLVSHCDTDNDGIFDYLDNDSDNDGCPDAIEASGTFTSVDGDGRLTGGVDINGVPTVVGATGQSTNADVITAGPDLDGDGIADACDATDDRLDSDNDGTIDAVDLDNDNDGILDADEQNCGTVNVIDDFNAPLWNYGTGNGGDASGSGTIKGVPFTMAYNVNGGSKLFSSTGQYTSNSTLGHGGNPGSLLLSGPDESVTFTFASPLTVVIGFDHVNANDEGWLFGVPADEVVSLMGSHEVIGSPASIDGVAYINDFAIPNITGVSYFKWVNITTLTITTTGPNTTTIGLNSLVSHCDTDGDGVFDYLDLDSDNDGITDVTEAGGTDADGDGILDGFFDGNGDGLDDNTALSPLPVPNTDGDVVPDYLDLDSDNDGITDVTEAGGIDLDGDGIIDGFTDTDGNGLDDATETTPLPVPSSDGDAVPDYLDLDSDDDGINDVVEAGGVDLNDDGIVDGFADSNNDGLDDTTAATPLPVGDKDNDGIPNYVDLDSDNDGILDATEGEDDFDNDGLPNYLDLDSDADGISDVIEAGGVDIDGDAHVDYATSGDPSTLLDANNNGLHDTLEGTPLPIPNTDSMQGADYVDIDADDDGIVDDIEGQTTAGYRPPSNVDADNDGLDDNYDGDDGNTVGVIDILDPNGAIVPTNTDGTDNPDYTDTDSDNDGDLDSLEGWDTNNDGTADTSPLPANADADGDGLHNAYDTDDSVLDATNGGTLPTDFPDFDTPGGEPDWREALDIDWDNDGINDIVDSDSDNDGIPDVIESGGNDPYGDEDGDGIENWMDTTDDGNAGDSSVTDYTDLDGNGIPDVYDIDGDGVPNHLDLDSDNDGIYDIVESGQIDALNNIVDVNNDGIIDAANSGTVGANGLFDPLEDAPDSGNLANLTADSDADGIPDSNEIDADNDGCNDVLEAGFTDGDLNGLLGNGTFGAGLFVDVNGIVTSGIDGYTVPDDLDSNSVYDFQQSSLGVPVINTNPISQTLIINANVTFSTDLLATITYRWYESTDAGATWTAITNGGASPAYSNATTDALTLTGVPASYDGYQYRVILSSPAFTCDSNWTSAPAVLSLFPDNDSDGVPNYLDLDSDNDGIPDTIESGGVDPYADIDADGIPAYLDDDDNDNTVGDDNGVIEPAFDSDGDGVPNYLDLDSDNDGIYDIVESGQLDPLNNIVDVNNDGVIDAANSGTVGTNGLFDPLEDAPDSGNLANLTDDSDADGTPDSNEIDADNDGCNDVREAGFTDGDLNGLLGNGTIGAGLLVDANGVVTSGVDGYTIPDDLDLNSVYDFQQTSLGIPLVNTDPLSQTIVINSNVTFSTDILAEITYQWYESTDGGATWAVITNGGASPAYSNATTDALTLSGVPLSYDGYQYRVMLSSPVFVCDSNWTSAPATLNLFPDNDGDGIPDITDLDDDNDGIPDTIEGVLDTDGDGILDQSDLDSDNDGIYDVVESGQLNGTTVVDLNNDGILDGNTADFGTNGLLDLIESDDTAAATLTNVTADSDGDSIPDSHELDADNDGCNDVIEAGLVDVDGSGRLGSDTGLTVDANGLVNTPGTTGYTIPNDLDNNSVFDFQEAGLAVLPIATQPLDDVIVVNANTSFSVDIQSTITYQWQMSTDAGVNWSNISNGGTVPTVTGATSDELTLTMVPLEYNGYMYRVVLSSPAFACDTDVISDPALLTVYPDFDGDGRGDPIDLDDDNDGIPDLMEFEGLDPLADNDGDGVPAYLDDNDNNISVGDANDDVESEYDFDGDGIANHFDLDADGDGILDVVEAGNADLDADNDGVIDGAPADFGINGLFDPIETDDTLLADINYVPWNSDGDSQLNFLDIDDDNDGILTLEETAVDSDGDTHPNYLDLDADDDGIPDNVEGQTTADYNSPLGVDANGDGLDDAYGVGLTPVNTDGADQPDYLDADSDNDAVPDSIEGHDYDANGEPDVSPSGNDDDNDGLDDAYDGSIGDFADPNGLSVDTDPATDLPNRDDALEADVNTAGLVTGDSEVDYRDIDDDGDGINTIDEDGDKDGDPTNDNCDEDAYPDYLDPTSCTIIPDGFSPNGDGDNDELVVPALAQYKDFEMEVYDRWGNIVYEYDNNGRAMPLWWDGYSSGTMTISKGNKVPVGTYYYIIKYNEAGLEPIAGWVYINY
ncbi:T9SS type B sorting domain-containing protein [Aureibaculum luteum]|uniref:T9SS type B sorting domain-containing protein n=1 Tax=Aureibaculum luteum TaxID=1548456 RepID=UPI000E510761|nr:gliding motility-associated C-terminal domain-containing protein [Aureibaculum luteum]